MRAVNSLGTHRQLLNDFSLWGFIKRLMKDAVIQYTQVRSLDQ